MFIATKLVFAGAIVALFGGALLVSGLPTRQEAVPVPGAEASAAPSALITGVVHTPDMERPVMDVRLTVSLLDANADPGAAALGEWVLERANQVPDPFGFTIQYAPEAIDANGVYVLETRLVESDNGRLMATGGEPIPVITDPDESTALIKIQLVVPDDIESAPRLTGVVVPDPNLPSPAAPARLVMTVVDASAAESAAPVVELTVENATRLRPPRLFSIDYSADAIEEAGDYVLETRLEDATTGDIIATGEGVTAVITQGNPVSDITVKLVAADGTTE